MRLLRLTKRVLEYLELFKHLPIQLRSMSRYQLHFSDDPRSLAHISRSERRNRGQTVRKQVIYSVLCGRKNVRRDEMSLRGVSIRPTGKAT